MIISDEKDDARNEKKIGNSLKQHNLQRSSSSTSSASTLNKNMNKNQRNDNSRQMIQLDGLINYFGVGTFTIKLMAVLGLICFANGSLANTISMIFILRWSCANPTANAEVSNVL